MHEEVRFDPPLLAFTLTYNIAIANVSVYIVV